MDFNSQTADDPHRPAKRRKTQFGLKELVTGEHPEVDIVAIHGIDGDREASWTADNGTLWLRDLLPEKIPNARILAYGYDANTHDQEQLTTEYMHGHATTFIAQLATFRRATSTLERPIIHVAHSSGGIMLKSALIHADLCREGHLEHHQAIARSTYGVAFFGTPHQGSAVAELARFILDISGSVIPTSSILLRHLERDSEALQQQLSQYLAVSIEFDTKFFYELYDTHFGAREFKKIVPKSSAVVPGTRNGEAIGIYKDHVNMIKFPSADDEDFKTVSRVLLLMSKAAPQKITQQWERHRRVDHRLGHTTISRGILSYNDTSLHTLPRVDAARFDADDRPHCLEGTRVELLKTIFNWVEQDSAVERRRIFLLSGQAGTGKTTISLTVAAGCQKKDRLGGSFFFSRDHAERNDLRLVFPSLAQQLGRYHAPFRALLNEILEQDPGVAQIDPQNQFMKLITEPISRCPAFPSAVLVIDALDECEDDKPISKLLNILSAYIRDFPLLKFFITSRPEIHIQCGFRQLGADAQSVILHEIEESVVDGDIELYLRNRFSTMTILYPYRMAPGWPSDEVIKTLVRLAGRLFIFAATAMNFILDLTYGDPYDQLNILLEQSQGNNLSSSLPFTFLDQLYLQVLRRAFPLKTTPSKRLALVRSLLGSILLLRDPLAPCALEDLLGLRRGDVRTTLRHLHSVIVVPDTDEHPIRLIHPSFFDFATSRCPDSDFRIDSSICHSQLAMACFEQMEGLKRDICNIHDPSKLNSEIEDLADRIAQYISPSMQYACRYWSYHMCNARNCALLGSLETFCHTKILYWIEALSLIDSLREGIRQIKATTKYINELPSPPKELHANLKEIARFIADYFDVISVASLQLYRTALPQSPKSIYRYFYHEAKDGLRILQGVECHPSEVTALVCDYSISGKSVAFSPDGKLIISIAFPGNLGIVIWDRGTGILSRVLKPPNLENIIWARVLPDNTRIISACSGSTIYIWNVVTGACLESIHLERTIRATFPFHHWYTCSPDFTHIVGAEGNNLLLWNAADGVILHILRGHFAPITSILFSPNGLLIVSSSEDNTIYLWDAVNGVALRVLRGQSFANCVAFSPNNRYIIFGTQDSDLHLLDAINGVALNTLRGHTGAINSVAFSPDGACIISGSEDKTIRVWDVGTGKMLNTIKCSGMVHNVGISPDGTQYIATMDYDCNIYLWDSDYLPKFDQSKKKWNFRDMVFSPDGTRILCTTKWPDFGFYLFDGHMGVLLEIIIDIYGRAMGPIIFSPDNKYFAYTGDVSQIYLYDISRRTFKSMTGHHDSVRSIAFSPWSTSIVSTSYDNTIRVWDVASTKNIFTIHTTTTIPDASFSFSGSSIITSDRAYDIPLQFRPDPARSNSKDAERGRRTPLRAGGYRIEKGWIYASNGSKKERCIKIPGAWQPCHPVAFCGGRAALGTRSGLVLVDLSDIKLSL